MDQTLKLSTKWVSMLPVALVAAGVIVIDQITKYWVRASFSIGEIRFDEWPVRLRYVENSGSAFGFFPNSTAVLIVASIIAMGIVVWMFRQTGINSLPMRLSFGLMLGGGIGNLVDRIRFGSVTDFIDLRFWPIFNIADSSVVVGITTLVVFSLLRETKRAKTG